MYDIDNRMITRNRLTTPATSAAHIPALFWDAQPLSALQGTGVVTGSAIGYQVDRAFVARMTKGRPPRGVPR